MCISWHGRLNCTFPMPLYYFYFLKVHAYQSVKLSVTLSEILECWTHMINLYFCEDGERKGVWVLCRRKTYLASYRRLNRRCSSLPRSKVPHSVACIGKIWRIVVEWLAVSLKIVGNFFATSAASKIVDSFLAISAVSNSSQLSRSQQLSIK